MKEKETDLLSGNKFWNNLKKKFVTDQVFWENEVRTNLFVAQIMTAMAGLLLLCMGLNVIGIFEIEKKLMTSLCIFGSLELIIPAIVCYLFKGRKSWIKYIMLLVFIFVLSRIDSILTFNVPGLIFVTVIISCCYYSQWFTVEISVISSILFAVSAYHGAMNVTGMPDMNFMILYDGSYADQQTYIRNIMIESFFPRWMLFVLVSAVCIVIARKGRDIVLAQHNISKEHSRVETELELANRIQFQALPMVDDFPQEENLFDLSVCMTPAKEVGGDFYDFFYLDPTHLALMIADVSGKGIPAALFMMISKILLEHRVDVNHSPADVLAEVNHELCEKNMEDMFVTVWLGILDLEHGDLVTASAGHEYPIFCRQGEEFNIIRDKHGFVLGGMDGIRYKENHLKIDPGDILFVYTDGVPEAINQQTDPFGMDRILETLNSYKNASMNELLEGMEKEINDFAAGMEQFDDITMLAIRLDHYKEMEGICLVPSLDRFPDVTSYVEGTLEENEIDVKLIRKFNVAVDEIYSNIVRYSGATWAQITCNVDEKSICIRFKDNGLPYDPLKEKDPDLTLSAEERAIGGLGIYMIQKIMDQVNYFYEDGYNIMEIRLNR